MQKQWPFEGLKVLDFTSGAVGPLTVRYLADHGATAVHVESRLRPDVCRTAGPFKDRIPDLDRSAWQPNYNASKFGLTLNMELPRARAIAWKLIEWCDVLAEGYTPGVMARWGMDYESVRQVKPEIIYFSTCQQGQYGPHADFRGYGNHAAAVAGMNHLMGWPDREPAAVFGAYTDFISPRFSAAAVIAALDFRRRTGKGQYIDLSQFEAGVTFLAPVIMDYTVNGRVQTRDGNRVPDAAPHNAYRCQGADRWVAIAVHRDDEWEAFCAAVGDPSLSNDAKFQTLLERKQNEEELDRLVEAWTSTRSPEDVVRVMQSAGIAAGLVANEHDVWEDPQMKHREHFKTLEHNVIGPHTYDGVAFKLSKSPQGPRWAGPTLGQHIGEVCSEFLGMSEDEIAECLVEGVFE
ncbi:CoA transferase [Candidatus Amarobacter glycogenicus]|uniref:CaiB/BaiF CoA transferase family protein n=1 Tax=Candidatus Amarobacter glycogenicus TaxID=3140699 RepID=UPI0031374EA0|nr:CoA transferase [Dehalococcoidia bacterium]